MKKTMRKVLSNEEKQYIHRILDEHMEMIVNTISRNVENPSYTADAVQSVAEKLMMNVKSLQAAEHPYVRLYILSTVKSVIADYRRSQRLRDKFFITVDFDPDRVPIQGSDLPLLDKLIQTEDHVILGDALASLPETDKELLIGRYVLERTDAELAKIFGCKPSSIRMMLTRARRRARALLKGKGVDLE